MLESMKVFRPTRRNAQLQNWRVGLVLNRDAPSTRQSGQEKKAFGALNVSKCATLKLVHRASGPSALKLSVAGAGRTRISTVIRNNRTDKNKAEEPLVCC